MSYFENCLVVTSISSHIELFCISLFHNPFKKPRIDAMFRNFVHHVEWLM